MNKPQYRYKVSPSQLDGTISASIQRKTLDGAWVFEASALYQDEFSAESGARAWIAERYDDAEGWKLYP